VASDRDEIAVPEKLHLKIVSAGAGARVRESPTIGAANY